MSVYRRGAIYWWCRRLKLGSPDPRSIMLRLSLKTSDKAEARSRALALDMELKMVALRFPGQLSAPTREQLEAVYIEALCLKRDQLASLHRQPPFDYEEQRRANLVMVHVYGALARSGSIPLSKSDWSCAMAGLADQPEVQSVFEEVASRYGMNPSCAALDIEALQEPGDDRPLPAGPRTPYPVAPRYVLHAIENAQIPHTPINRQTVVAIMAAAYEEALLEANEDLSRASGNGWRRHLPAAMERFFSPGAVDERPSADGPSPLQSESQTTEKDVSVSVGITVDTKPSPVAGGMVDLTVSELCNLAIAEKTGALAWGDSAQRNARLIGNIFIAVNGDLQMSQIEQRHLLAVRAHLDIMPAVWGKSAGDKEGGFPAVFKRGKSLAAIWKANPVAAKINNTAKVGLEVPTFNRHIRTLKQLFGLAMDQQDANGVRTHVAPMVSFRGLTRKDHRRQNALKPVPTREEVDLLLCSPLHMGCAGLEDRFTPGPIVIHDSGYWMPLILAVYGPRSNEFCQMPLSHVIENSSVPYFRIREWEAQSVKTPATNRDLPIAPLLIELGLLDYVRALREKGEWWLFPELNQTKEKPRKVLMDDVFTPLLEATFPNGTSVKIGDKDIDTQSIRKFLTSFLRRARPKIDLGDRQYFFGHQRKTTLEGIYEADPRLKNCCLVCSGPRN